MDDGARLSYRQGTFDVQSYSPWPGYVMDTGTWHVGDFNGDGRADLLHVLPGKNSVNIWLSKGRGSFKVTNFLPWPDYLIEKGRWLVGDFDNDGYADVVQVLESEGRVNIWLSTGDGISTFSPGPSYAISTGPWLTGDFNGDGSSNLLHGMEGTNYAKVWLSNFPGPLTATILVCSLSTGIAFEDCDRSTAVHVIDVPERFYGPIMCMMRGQAYLAGTEIGRQSAADERVKIVCHRRTHVQKPRSANKTSRE
jgi:hypothetical protein